MEFRRVLFRSGRSRFMPKRHRLAELAPRDVVAREIFREQHTAGPVYLDARRLGRRGQAVRFSERFPGITALCRARGIDPDVDLIPVTPAAHYMMGGIVTDLAGRSSLPRLYACGEVARTGVHGANRLASNSLLEGLVFAERVARDLLATPKLALVPRRARRPRAPPDAGDDRGAEHARYGAPDRRGRPPPEGVARRPLPARL